MATQRAIVLTERAMVTLAKTPGLTQSANLLLWHLVSTLPIAGQILNLTELSEHLGLTKSTVTIGMLKLLKAGFVIRGPKVGRVHTYKLNSAYFHHL
jgi:DNA-binding MarR family transcriptional regulator